jgi:hypothetical protein
LVQRIDHIPHPYTPNNPLNATKEWTLYNVNDNKQLSYLNCVFNFGDDNTNNQKSEWRACATADFPNIPGNPKYTTGEEFAAAVRLYMEEY